MLRPLSILAALTAAAAANAQSPEVAAPAQVSQLAPQLVAFSGSQANFDSIINGLTQGVPVTIATTDTAGNLQIATFSPPATLSPTDAARVVEAARNALITRGVSTPTAQQIAVSLVGGPLVTSTGTTTLPAAIPGTTSTTLVQVRNQAASAPVTTTGATLASGNNLQALRASLAQAGLSTFEANQSLQLAANLLAQNGIVNPTPEQLQTALNGGSLVLANGQIVALAGVLPGRLPASAGATTPPGVSTPAVTPFRPDAGFSGASSTTLTVPPTPSTSITPAPGLTGAPGGLTAAPVAGPTQGGGVTTRTAPDGPGLRR